MQTSVYIWYNLVVATSEMMRQMVNYRSSANIECAQSVISAEINMWHENEAPASRHAEVIENYQGIMWKKLTMPKGFGARAANIDMRPCNIAHFNYL